MDFMNALSAMMSSNGSSLPVHQALPTFTSDALHQVDLHIAAVSYRSIPWVTFGLIISFYVISQVKVHLGGPKFPLFGLRSVLEPRYLANWRFFRNAGSFLDKGYAKVCGIQFLSLKSSI
jgi:hypothetical protein